jgi:PAS domain S-box-containing protein
MVHNRVFDQVNDRICEMTGFSREELIGQSSRMVYPSQEEYDQVGRDKYDQVRRLGVGTVETRWQRKDGAILDILLSSSPLNPDDWAEGVIFTATDITDKKRAEVALRESEERRRILIETTATGYVILDEQGKVMDANAEYVRLAGCHGLEEIRGRSVLEWTAEYEKKKNAEAVAQCLRDGYIRNFEVDYVDPRGKTTPVEINATVEREGNVRLILTLCRDITERKRAEEKLQKSQAMLRSILDATPFPIALVDLQDNVIHYWSRSALALFGHTAPTAAQWYEIAYPDPEYRQEVIDRWKPFLEKARSSGQTVNTGEYRISCHDGSVRMCELYATFLAENLIVTFNDITERHQAESQLRESEEKFSKTFRLSPEMISISRLSDGTYCEVNEAFERIMGFTRQETIGRTSTELGIWVDPQDRARMVEVLRERHGLHQFETKIFRKDRSIITALFSASPIEIRGEQYLLAIVMDITERIRAEQQHLCQLPRPPLAPGQHPGFQRRTERVLPPGPQAPVRRYGARIRSSAT